MKIQNNSLYSKFYIYLPNVLHMERFSINAIIGNTITPEPKLEIISNNPIVAVPSCELAMLKLGLSKFGKPDGILPRTHEIIQRLLLKQLKISTYTTVY